MTKEQYDTLYKLFREYEKLEIAIKLESDYVRYNELSSEQDIVRGQFLTFMATLIK